MPRGKISGISRASGLPRPYFQNADPGRHAPCQSRAATTLPLATFNLPSRNNLQNKPNSAATMSLPCSRFATAQPQTPVGCAAWRRRFRIFLFRYRENDVRNDDDIFDSDVFPAGDSFTGSGETARGGFGFLWGLLRCRGCVLTTGVVIRAPCRLRRDGTRGFLFWGAGAVAVCFEGCCESMCWPVDRPATHAAAGAAARGV